VHTIDLGPRSNKLLASLPQKDFQLLFPHLSDVQLAQGTVLCEPGDDVAHVYFPLSGAVSLLVVMRNGKTTETGAVGREGERAFPVSSRTFQVAEHLIMVGRSLKQFKHVRTSSYPESSR